MALKMFFDLLHLVKMGHFYNKSPDTVKTYIGFQ